MFLPREIVADRFQVIHLLGQGGMAQVFAAEDLELGQAVAIKVIRPELAASRHARELFKREVVLARQITHPNVCRIYDVFQHRGAGAAGERGASRDTPVLVMELVRGETLARHLAQSGPLAPAAALAVVDQLAGALDAAHRSQVVHGDFKSGNVILEPGPGGPRAVVTDFGLAQPAAMAGGAAGGTTAYMAPEQRSRRELSPASDIYAFAVVICEMVTGRRPPPAGRGLGGLAEVAAVGAVGAVGAGAAPEAGSPALPPGWREVLAGCLAESPCDRPASAGAVARSLAAATSPSAPGAAKAPIARRPPVRYALATVLSLACLAALGSWPAERHEALSPDGARGARTVADAAPGAAAAKQPAVAVMDLADASPRRAAEWLPAALAHQLVLELGADGQAEVFQVAPGGRAPPDADFVAAGSFVLTPGEPDPAIRVALELTRAPLAQRFASLAESGRMSQVGGVIARLSAGLRLKLGIPETSPEGRRAATALRPRSLQAEGLYARGVCQLQQGRLMAAYATLGQAVTADPEFCLSHAALARVYAGLRYEQHARDEAALAARRSQLFPERQRLELAAVSRRVNADLAGAAGLFRTLWRLAPRDRDYGLQLAESLLESGRPREALAALQALRAGGADSVRGAALDVLESRARFKVTELQAALAAALAGEVEAARSGNPEVLAAADLEEAAARSAGGDAENAAGALARAQELFRRTGFRGGEAEVVRFFASLANEAGKPLRAKQLYDQALELFNAVGSTWGAATVLKDTGVNEWRRSNLGPAAQLLERARAGFHRVGDRVDEAAVVSDLALVVGDSGQWQRAEALFAEAIGIDAETGDRKGMASLLINLANGEGLAGRYGAAQRHIRESLRICEELGYKAGEAIGHVNLALTWANSGDLHAAEPEFQLAIRLSREARWTFVEASALGGLGELRMQQGRFAAAESSLRQALALPSSNTDRGAVARIYRDLAWLALWEARFGAAEALGHQVVEGGQIIGAETLSIVAVAQAEGGRLREARQTLGRARRLLPAAYSSSESALFLALAAARIALAGQRPAEAARPLEDALQRFAGTPNPDVLFESRLFLAIAEIRDGRTAAACSGLRSLAAETRRGGYDFLAHEAERLLAGQPACPPG